MSGLLRAKPSCGVVNNWLNIGGMGEIFAGQMVPKPGSNADRRRLTPPKYPKFRQSAVGMHPAYSHSHRRVSLINTGPEPSGTGFGK